MQQITYGETLKKVKVVGRETVDSFLKDHEALFLSLFEAKNCLYQDSKIVSDQALNYLNAYEDSADREQLKILLKKEFLECEKRYPYLGDLFIDKFFVNKSLKKQKDFVLTSISYHKFVDTLKFKQNKDIFNWIVENSSLEFNISIQKSVLDIINVEKIDYLNFDIEYDNTFLGNMKSHTMNEYKFIIIDGHIDSVGEVHHLLNEAYESKIPHVIFCLGMNPEVEHVIKYNNTHGKFEVFPIIIPFNENTLNVLNDIAVLHNAGIVSSKSGQTISSAIREDLPSGNKITLHKSGFKIKPVADYRSILIHKNFLEKRINEATHQAGKDLLVKRLKRFSSKSIKIFLPEKVYENNDLVRELDYMLRFLNFSKFKFSIFSFSNKRYFLPEGLEKLVDSKVESLNNIFKNIEKLVTHAGN